MSNFLRDEGVVRFTVPSGSKVAVWGRGKYVVTATLGGDTFAPSPQELTSQTGLFTSAAFGADATVEIKAYNVSDIFYEYGTAPVVKEYINSLEITAANAVNTTASITAAMIYGRVITSTTASAVTGTLPTFAVLDATSNWAVGESMDWTVINTGGSNAFTVAGDTGHTITGLATVAASTSGSFRTTKTTSSAFLTYRL